MKPGNILLKSDQESKMDQVKLADFGLTQEIDRALSKSSVRAADSLRCMSPEALEGDAQQPVDI